MSAIHTDNAPAAIGPYSQGRAFGSMLITSGQLPVDMRTGALESENITLATRCCLENISAILDAGGMALGDVVKTTVFLTDLNDFAAMNAEYAHFFPGEPPARSCVQVAALPKGAHIEIEAMAVKA